MSREISPIQRLASRRFRLLVKSQATATLRPGSHRLSGQAAINLWPCELFPEERERPAPPSSPKVTLPEDER